MTDRSREKLVEAPRTPVPELLKSHLGIKVARGAGELMSRLVYSEQELIVHLGNTLAQHDHDVASTRGLKGAILKWLMPKDLENVVLDGLVSRQAFEFAGVAPPPGIDIRTRYSVPAETARLLLQAISE